MQVFVRAGDGGLGMLRKGCWVLGTRSQAHERGTSGTGRTIYKGMSCGMVKYPNKQGREASSRPGCFRGSTRANPEGANLERINHPERRSKSITAPLACHGVAGVGFGNIMLSHRRAAARF